jgi:hypothetical protein
MSLKPFLIALCLLVLSASVEAQLFSSALKLQEGPYEYRTVPVAATASAFVTQANAQGGERFAFVGNQIFGNPSGAAVAIYGRAPLAANVSYQSFPALSSAAALVTQLNAQGAQGFRYLGDLVLEGAATSLLAKDSATDSFTYQQLPLATNPTDFLTQLNTQGAAGFSFEGNIGFFDGVNFVFSSLFVKNTAHNSTFVYETRSPATAPAGFLTLVNAQGARGFRYRGDIAFGATINSLFVKDNARTERYVFEVLTPSASSTAFLTQANAQGARNFSYLGDIAFTAPNLVISSIYVSVRGVMFASGFEP